jgi:Transcriptional regulator, AbiEi antitoxin, Type IV TA system
MNSMAKRFLISSHESLSEHNIYADKSALVLEWLFFIGFERLNFSVREVSRDKEISIGLVQRVFEQLVYQGHLKTTGVRTSKKFSFKKPQLLLEDWFANYDITKKCKMWSYRSGLFDRKRIMQVIQEANLPVSFALHAAAEVLGVKNTNLQTVELYLGNPQSKEFVEKTLLLEPQERGYEVLLIAPYYKSMLKAGQTQQLSSSSPLLTLLDLYHFPLRGQEQAQFMLERMDLFKHFYKRN